MRAAFPCAVFTSALAVAGLLGWATPWRRLASLQASTIPMAPSTALGLLLLGAAVAAHSRWPSPRRTAVASLVAGAASAVYVVLFALGLPSFLDVVLVPSPDMFGRVPTGRISPLTAVTLTLASLGLLLVTRGRGRHAPAALGAGLALAVAGLGTVVTLGYLFGAPLLYGGTVVPMAFTTGLAVASLGVALVDLAPRDTVFLRAFAGPSTRARLLRAFLPVAPVMVAVSVVFERVEGVNPGVHAALATVVSALVVALFVLQAARRVGGALDRAEAERREGEMDLRRAEERFARVFHSGLIAIGIAEVRSGRLLDVNARCAQFFGYERAEMVGRTVFELGIWANPADRQRFVARIAAGAPATEEVAFRRKTGEIRFAIASMEALTLSGVNEPLNLMGLVDLTDHKRLELQLLQAQKLEAIGRLAGGIAHDFNNVLGVIVGYGELLARQATEAQRGRLDQILKAAQRAAGLTRQLLAFSRRTVIEPKVLDLNVLVSDLQKMLGRLIGEDVDLAIVRGDGLGHVKADPGQLEQVLMNLCINARDAMPEGGVLRIETARVELGAAEAAERPPMTPGRYARLTVSDTGCGIPPQHLSRIFEPFFTTKEQGKGTGLGLATVYGIVKQAGGFVWVASEVGRGTTFTVYLPSVDEPAASAEARPAALPPRGSETILVVEDEASLRAITREILETHGYRVLEAGEAGEALAIARSHAEPIHLLLTDVVMPGTSGRGLAEALLASRPGLRVLYMSGYTDDIIANRGVLAEGTLLLNKPFDSDALLRRVREALDPSPPPSPP